MFAAETIGSDCVDAVLGRNAIAIGYVPLNDRRDVIHITKTGISLTEPACAPLNPPIVRLLRKRK
jgi:hypothetical protein